MFMPESGAGNLDRSFGAPLVRLGEDGSSPVVLARRAARRDPSRWAALQLFLRSTDWRRPVIVIDGFGAEGWAGWCWRGLVRPSTLLLYLSEPPRKRLGWSARRILRRVDGVLADGHAAGLAATRLGYPAHRIGLDASLDRYGAVVPARLPETIRRVVVVGALTPASGAYDLLLGLAAWSARRPGYRVEVVWVGTGQLFTVLAAQPETDNLTQTFLPDPDEDGIVAALQGGGLLAVPSLTDAGRGHVAEALAAGLPVLGSRRNGEVRRHVTDDVTGWLFDPLVPGDMESAIARCLGTSGDRLAEMGVRAREAMAVPRHAVMHPARPERPPAPSMAEPARSPS